jgi:hypothetical protein
LLMLFLLLLLLLLSAAAMGICVLRAIRYLAKPKRATEWLYVPTQ